MAATPPPGYTPVPTPAPQRGDRSTFSGRLDAFISWLATGYSDMAAMVSNAYTNAQAANTSAGAANSSAGDAQTAAGQANGYKNNAADSATAAAASAASALNAPGTSATSTTNLTIGTVPISLTIQTGKSFSPGQTLVIASTASPDNQMVGVITSYNSGSGALGVNVKSSSGSGTFGAWSVALQGSTGPAGIAPPAVNIFMYNNF